MVFLFLLGCSSHQESKEIETVQISELSKDIKVTKQIFLDVEKDINADLKGVSASYVFIPIKIKFLQHDSQALKSDEIIYSFPKGGGQLDLKMLVQGQGSFYVSFPKSQFAELPDLEHLYYISDSPTKTIDGETFGLGCYKWIDLKKQFSKLQTDDFLKLNTSEQRHQYVLNGTYIFVFRKATQVYMSQLTITDSETKIPTCSGKG